MATILIIEDDPDTQQLMRTALERDGHSIELADNGVDALYRINALHPDLIILDLMMPLASGDAVLGYIRSTRDVRDTRVLVVSAHPNAERLASQLEADDVLIKPIELAVLRDRVKALIGEGA